jgi:hypothetical protein
MVQLSAIDVAQLIYAIATREGTARELAQQYDMSVDELRVFTDTHMDKIKCIAASITKDDAVVTPTQLDELWISKKFERLLRLQVIADITYKAIKDEILVGSELATAIREFRSYLMLAANELGQLLHRGSGDSGQNDTLSVDIQGVDMDSLR